MSTPETTTQIDERVADRFQLKALVEACLVLEEGIAGVRDIDLGMMMGTGMVPGPFARADFRGLDTLGEIAVVMIAGLAILALTLVAAGCLTLTYAAEPVPAAKPKVADKKAAATTRPTRLSAWTPEAYVFVRPETDMTGISEHRFCSRA